MDPSSIPRQVGVTEGSISKFAHSLLGSGPFDATTADGTVNEDSISSAVVWSGLFDATTADGIVDEDSTSSARESIRAIKRQASCIIYDEPSLASTNPQWPPVSV